MKMIGVFAERARPRMRAAVWKPSSCGMLTSSRITANSVAQERAQRFGAGARGDDAVVAVGEDRLEREQLVGAVVDQQHVDRRRRAHLELGAHGALREGSRYRCSQLRSWATRWSASTGLAM